MHHSPAQGMSQGRDAVQFINSLPLRDLRASPQYFAQSQRVREAIWAWGPMPCDDDTFSFSQLKVHTDGSAILSRGRPALPIAAGWGALLFRWSFQMATSGLWEVFGAQLIQTVTRRTTCVQLVLRSRWRS